MVYIHSRRSTLRAEEHPWFSILSPESRRESVFRTAASCVTNMTLLVVGRRRLRLTITVMNNWLSVGSPIQLPHLLHSPQSRRKPAAGIVQNLPRQLTFRRSPAFPCRAFTTTVSAKS